MTTFSTIDHALGGADGRYFGQGHRRSRYEISRVRRGSGRVDACGTVAQLGTWSTKSTGVVSRHLSSLDAIALAALALEPLLASEPVVVESLVVSSLSIRTGATPTEDLSGVPVTASIQRRSPDGSLECSAAVGGMKLKLAIEEVPVPSPGPDSPDRPVFFAEHLRRRVQHISDIDIDRGTGVMQARIGALSTLPAPGQAFSGLQSSHGGLLSISEATVCLAQLAQAMAYEIDGIRRDESAVFWLRRLDVRLASPRILLGQVVDLDVRVLRADVVSLGSRSWRTLRMAAEGDGLSAVADVAHILSVEGSQ